MTRLTVGLLAVVGLLNGATAYALPILVLDQANTVLPIGGGGPISATGFGQTFTPSLTGIDAADFVMGDLSPGSGSGGVFQLAIRETGPGGASLGTSAAVALPNGFGSSGSPIVNFGFASVVPLVPGNTYFMEIQAVSGDLFTIAGRNDNQYAGGNFFTTGGVSAPTADAWFREGLSSIPTPAPDGGSTLLLTGIGVFALIGFGVIRKTV